MQVPQADSSQSKRVGVDEQFIKFKSSLNFKEMKKFIRSKIVKTETSNQSSPNNHLDPPPPPNLEPSFTNKLEQQPTADTLESSSDAPSSNADMETENYGSPNEPETSESFPPQEEAKRPDTNGEEVGKPPESTIMCRDFIRGTCNRPGTCRYAHKCDKTQLFGVYTFCRNYQNKICTLPNCKYVHASVFEEQEFYRTGKLPPHVLMPKVMPPPPPPPHERLNIPTSFTNPPPMLPPSIQASSSMFACVPTTSSDTRMFHEEFGMARDNYGEPPPKKCKNCDMMDIKVRCLNDLVDKKREIVEDWKRKINEVEAKKDKMCVIVMGLLKLTNSSASTVSPSSLFNISGGDKTKMIMEQLISLNSSNRISVGGGDSSSSGLLGENFSMATMLANFLTEHQAHSADVGRRE